MVYNVRRQCYQMMMMMMMMIAAIKIGKCVFSVVFIILLFISNFEMIFLSVRV
jgi:hypothetical protein